MSSEGLFDEAFWEQIVKALPELVDNPEGADHLVFRFAGQYLPALVKARNDADVDRIWMSFWNYLVAPMSSRKPFGLSSQGADRLIAQLQQGVTERM